MNEQGRQTGSFGDELTNAAMIGLVVFGQRLDLPAVIGLCLIVAGVVVINVFSRTVGH